MGKLVFGVLKFWVPMFRGAGFRITIPDSRSEFPNPKHIKPFKPFKPFKPCNPVTLKP